MLIRLTRGSGISGLAAMAQCRRCREAMAKISLVRPLLGVAQDPADRDAAQGRRRLMPTIPATAIRASPVSDRGSDADAGARRVGCRAAGAAGAPGAASGCWRWRPRWTRPRRARAAALAESGTDRTPGRAVCDNAGRGCAPPPRPRRRLRRQRRAGRTWQARSAARRSGGFARRRAVSTHPGRGRRHPLRRAADGRAGSRAPQPRRLESALTIHKAVSCTFGRRGRKGLECAGFAGLFRRPVPLAGGNRGPTLVKLSWITACTRRRPDAAPLPLGRKTSWDERQPP